VEKKACCAPVKQKSCCHSQKPIKQNSDNPNGSPKPGKLCHCESAPIAPNDVSRLLPDQLESVLGTPSDTPLASTLVRSELCFDFELSSPPLYVCHCVWLC
jgi:hypothetical protein